MRVNYVTNLKKNVIIFNSLELEDTKILHITYCLQIEVKRTSSVLLSHKFNYLIINPKTN